MNEEMNEGKGEESDQIRSEETVGEILLATRERNSWTLEYVSQETRIPAKTLGYLETDNFEALPAKVYVKGFLRAYASLLGLDVEHILNKYEVQTGQTHKSKGDLWEIETEVIEEKLGSPKVFKRFVLPAIFVIVVIVLFAKWFGGKEERRVEPPPITSIEEELLKRDEQTATPVVIEEIQQSVEPMELRLIANPTDSTWFELITISTIEEHPETTAYNFLLLPGRSRSFQATDEFILKKVGNAGGFVMELNGNKLLPLGKKGRVKSDVKITKSDLPSGG